MYRKMLKSQWVPIIIFKKLNIDKQNQEELIFFNIKFLLWFKFWGLEN